MITVCLAAVPSLSFITCSRVPFIFVYGSDTEPEANELSFIATVTGEPRHRDREQFRHHFHVAACP